MKYGIINSPEETSCDRRDIESERDMASENESSAASMAKQRQQTDNDAVIFSIQFYGKTIGEVGLMDQDLSELDWKKFKCYLFQNLLSVNQQENICVSYSDEEGDKLPIDSDEEYREALKVAKKKAEMHDKLVLDITRQGGFPAVLSMVSSGIKKVSSSPPKEGGISFFKASSPPKDNHGFKAIGTERKLFQGFFMHDKGPIPGHVQGVWGYDCDEALECGKVNTTSTTTTTTTTTSPVPTLRSDCKRGPPIRSLRSSPPNLLFNFEAPSHNVSPTLETSACQDVFGAGIDKSTGARPKDVRFKGEVSEQPPEWFTSYMDKFRAEICEEISDRVISKVTEALKISSGQLPPVQVESHGYGREQLKLNKTDAGDRSEVNVPEVKYFGSVTENSSGEVKKKKDCARGEVRFDTVNLEYVKSKKDDDKGVGVKRKKHVKEEERLSKEERRRLKRQEYIEKTKLKLTNNCKYADELDRTSRTQEKVLAKMEGLRKKQFCSQEELSKLRKMVDKQQRFMSAEQRQQRRSERKAGYQKAGRAKKISIDNKCYPVDASLLHSALQELEALAEDSTSDCVGGAMTRGYDALYLKDITYPDGSVVRPGKEFVKTWRVVNNGVMPWNEKTTLCKWSQVRFRGSPAGWKLKPSMKRVVCPPLEPGKEGDISITFTAPSEPGWYATHWRFCQRGRVFGNQMWCAIRVEEEPSASVAPESQLEEILLNSTGASKQSFARDVVHDLSTGILHHGIRETVFENYSSGGAEASKVIAPPREELARPNDLGIVENYYDAEDPVQRDCIESLQSLTLSCPTEPGEAVEEKREKDLISFEEEAEVIDSGSSTPELIPCVTQTQVVPLKEMAKESVESLILKEQELKSSANNKNEALINQSDSISMSSGSFSEIDSEDQAILNESDSDGSDHEYYVVHLPDCFNTNSLLEDSASNEDKAASVENTVVWPEETDRPDSPDFLTADEDDRTTAVASDSSEDLTCPVNEHNYASRSSSVSQASGSTNPGNSQCKTQVQNGCNSSLPDPPTDTKPFMAIPSEALQTNLLYSASQSKSVDHCNQPRKDQDPGTWASGANNQSNVVCEQPYSSQHKESRHSGLSSDGSTSALGESTTTTTSQMPVDLVGALPDELVSIIPEDLVRGAWNTARSFITRINQEMLSPTSDSPGRVFPCEEESANEPTEPVQRTPVPNVEAKPEEPVSELPRTPNTAQKETTPPLAPPMQQLEDMGFHNREVNERLLTKYNGDVSCAVAELIVLDCH